jgi:DCN1-like protein 1/2
MKAKISSLEVKYQSSKDFKKIYIFAFKYSLSPGQRSLGLETAIPLWECLIGSKYPHLESWIEFLQTEYNKAISKDTWNQVI